MNTTTKPELDLSAFVIRIPRWLVEPIERATEDEAGRLAMLDAMDPAKEIWQ